MALGDSTRINTNIGAFNALNALKSINNNLERSQLRLATGSRINEVADDPAGFVISRRLEARVRGLSAALDNTGTAKNLLAIAEGGLLNISDILVTIKEKVTQAASDSMSSAERNTIRTEVQQLTSEIDDIVSETTFNNRALIDGTFTGLSFQTGEDTTNVLSVSLASGVASADLSIASATFLDQMLSASGASSALSTVDTGIETVSNQLQQVGSLVARLSVKESQLTVAITNNQATRSRINDADFANEQLNSTRLLILQQTATAQLAQANITPQNVLALFV